MRAAWRRCHPPTLTPPTEPPRAGGRPGDRHLLHSAPGEGVRQGEGIHVVPATPHGDCWGRSWRVQGRVPFWALDTLGEPQCVLQSLLADARPSRLSRPTSLAARLAWLCPRPVCGSVSRGQVQRRNPAYSLDFYAAAPLPTGFYVAALPPTRVYAAAPPPTHGFVEDID